jgi:hypothetical protein
MTPRENVMQDIVDPQISPRTLGRIYAEPDRLAGEALKALKAFAVPTTVFLDEDGIVLALPAAYATDRAMDDIVGTYAPGISLDDIADDLRASAGPRLAAIGILMPWQDTCLAA